MTIMKKMKLLSLLLALVMMLSVFMTGCNKDDKDDTKEEPTTPTVAEGVDPNLSLGIVKDYTYTNKYMGIGITLDEDWTLQDAKTLQKLPGELENMLDGTLVGEVMKNVTYYMDMQATATIGTNVYSMNVLMQKLTSAQKALFKNMTDEQIIDQTLLGKDSMIESYKKIGMSDIVFSKVQVQYLGETRTVLRTDSKLYGMTYTILQVMDYSLGEYSSTLTVACAGEDNCAELLAKFEKI